jgi:UPF0755 protein
VKRLKRLRMRCCGCLMVPLVLLVGGVWWAGSQLGPAGSSKKRVAVVIEPGTGSARVAEILQEKGLIHSAFVFLWYARLHGDAAHLKAGEYSLSPSMTAEQVIARLKRAGSDAEDKRVTIPEGFTLSQIADTLAAKGIVPNKEDFLKVVKSGSSGLKAPFELPSSGLEGYLYPDTYRLAVNSPPSKVAQLMLDTFATSFYDKHKDAINQSGHSLHEIVTIASLIEREAEVPQDRARIAGVIENRLKRHMKLDIDATVLYALGHHKNRVMYKDLQVKSPYNTYRHIGLPPGPIASPGLPSLEAALAPERHDFLFYVATPDGSHVFARTEAEHNKNVARLRALKRSAPAVQH